jgi:hypothetical protein
VYWQARFIQVSIVLRRPIFILDPHLCCFIVETGEAIGYLEWKEDVIQETGADYLLMAVRGSTIVRVVNI